MLQRLWLWGPVVALMQLIFWLSSQQNLPAPPGHLTDKQAHALIYGALAAATYRALAGGRWTGLTLARGCAAASIAVAYGVSDEWHQRFVFGRSSDLQDLMADAAGALFAAVTLWACGIIAARLQLRPVDSSR